MNKPNNWTQSKKSVSSADNIKSDKKPKLNKKNVHILSDTIELAQQELGFIVTDIYELRTTYKESKPAI